MFSRLKSLDVRLSAKGERLRVSAPKGTLTTTLREQIANHKQEILALLRSGAATFNANSVIRPVGSNDPSPLSFAQQRLWFLDQFETHSSVFNLCRAFRISGPLHLRALEASLNEILRRHEALWTKFMLVDGLPLLTVASVEYLTIPLLDLPVRSEGERQSQSRRLILEETKRPFDLPEGRLLRVRLLRVGEDKYLLMFVTHHLVADAWSMGIFMRELWSFYDDYRNGRQPRLPAPACRYRDYALWQQQRLQDE
ncbi:MAG TPA: condensation domain-containing protein, partial [Candidatus Binatia bacterium]|nr:condensation domain-containing protein [Candidatus Binatia bacterium]